MKQTLKIGIEDLKYGNELKSKSHNWKGGRIIYGDGYVMVYCPDHPNHNNDKYVREHRLIMEKHLGRYLLPTERVHHINCIKTDNRIENLQLFNSESEHQSLSHHKYKEFICKGREKDYYHNYYLTHKEKWKNINLK